MTATATQLVLFMLLLVASISSAVIIRVGSGNCGGFGCDFGAFNLQNAINSTVDGDVIELYGQIFVNPDIPTPNGFSDTIYTITTSITIAGVAGGLQQPSIQIISPGTKGLNLFTLAANGIELADFPINRQTVSNKDNNPNVATIRLRNFLNGTTFPADDIIISNIDMTDDQPFLGTNIIFENGTFSNTTIVDCSFRAATAIQINQTSSLTDIKINRNRFLWSAYKNLNPAAKALNIVDLRLNFWRPCPYRGPTMILPELGVQADDTWWPYCVSENCSIPGPIATPDGSGGFKGWLSIQQALTSSQPDPLPVYVTAPFFMINESQIIYRRIELTSFNAGCVQACFSNVTNPVVVISNSSAATIGFIVLGDLMSMSNLQFELMPATRLALYRQAEAYNEATFNANRGALAFMSEAFNGNPKQDVALNTALITNFSAHFSISSGGDMTLQNLQILGGVQALLFWGPNEVGSILLREMQLNNVLFDAQTDFGLYLAGPTFTTRLESNYFGSSPGIEFGMLAEKLSGMDVLRCQIIRVSTGIALSQVNNSNLDCNSCVDASNFCITVMTQSSGNVASWNTFAVSNGKRFSRVPNSANTLAVKESINLGAVAPLSRVFQQFSSDSLPYNFNGGPMFTSSDDILLSHISNSTVNAAQNASSSFFVKETYLPVNNIDCFNYRDSLSSMYTVYSNVRDGCGMHSVVWNPFDNSTLSCNALTPIVQRIPDFTWTRTGSSAASGDDCILRAANSTEDLRFAVGTRTMRNAFVCAACDGDVTPFQNKTCDFTVDSFQAALEQVRISQLEDATILVNGICFVFNEEIDVEGLTIENCGDATLSPTLGPTAAAAAAMSMATEAEFQLRITVNFTTIQGITFEAVGNNVTYADDYCVVFIDGELLPIFNTTLFNNSFLQPAVDQLCTLMDTFTNVESNRFKDSRHSVKMSADSNEMVPEVSGINVYKNNDFENGFIHMFYGFDAPIRRPTQPYSRLAVIDNSFTNPRDVSLDVLGINGRRSRQDMLFQGNRYTNPTPDSSACNSGSSNPDTCCPETKGCDSFAQRFVDSEDALFDNERYFGGAVMQMAGRNVLVTNSKWRDSSGAVAGASDIALLQNPFAPRNVTLDNVDFAKDAFIVCNLGRSFNPTTGMDSMLHVMNAVINGQNIGVSKDDCEQTMIGVLTSDCVDRQGRQIFSARNTAPFEAHQFIEPSMRIRMNCTDPFVFIPSQQGGTGTCNCEFLPEDQFIADVPFVPPATSNSRRMTRQVEQEQQVRNTEVKNCPTGQIHNPNNRSECIEGTPTATPTPEPTPSPPTPSPPTPSPPHSPSSSSSSGDVHHLWWLWIIAGVAAVIVIIGLVIWAFVRWRRGKTKPTKSKEEEQELVQMKGRQQPSKTPAQSRRRSTTNSFGGSNITF